MLQLLCEYLIVVGVEWRRGGLGYIDVQVTDDSALVYGYNRGNEMCSDSMCVVE